MPVMRGHAGMEDTDVKMQKYHAVVLAIAVVAVFGLAGCAKGPTNEEAAKAVAAMPQFAGGVEKFTLQGPIVVLETGSRNKDGSWPVKVKFTAGYKMADGKDKPAVEKTAVFKLYRSGSSDHIMWTAR